MTISRRDILLQGSVIGAGLIAPNVTGIEALAQGQPPLRQSLANLQLNDEMEEESPGEKRLGCNAEDSMPPNWAWF